MQDRNFDDIAGKFSQNIYGTTKGAIRQAIVGQELDKLLITLPQRALQVLDAGCGEGQMACRLARQGHNLLLCDLSEEMLKRARQYAEQHGVLEKMRFEQVSAHDVGQYLLQPVDLILSHAVLEWVEKPQALLETLYQLLSPGGVLSLMFYNLHGLTMRMLTLGNFGYLQAGLRKRKKKTLSPDYPRDPEQVYQWLAECGFQIESRAGIRVFHDYMRDKQKQSEYFSQVLEMEERYCRQEPYLSMGRYIHVTARKPIQKDEL